MFVAYTIITSVVVDIVVLACINVIVATVTIIIIMIMVHSYY